MLKSFEKLNPRIKDINRIEAGEKSVSSAGCTCRAGVKIDI